MKEPDTAEEPEQLKRDFDTAMALLWGLYTKPPNAQYVPLSGKTEPTETQAREALDRLLGSIIAEFPIGHSRTLLLGVLREVFAPHTIESKHRTTPLKAVLRRRSQSAKTTPYRDFAAVREVWRRRLLDKESYENATANTAAAFGYADPSQIRKLYGRDKELWKVWLSLRKRAPDRQTMIRVLEEASVALDRQTRE